MKIIKAFNWQIGFLTTVCIVLLICRVFMTENFRYIFLIWNLILAYVPYYIASKINTESIPMPIKLVLICVWLVFFPNAPYLVTDFVHINNSTSAVIWFDVVLLFMFAYTGMYMAIKSADVIHTWLISKLGNGLAILTIVISFLLSGFGIYLGRVERWNSWNIINQPFSLLNEILQLILKKNVWEFSIVYFILIGSVYVIYRSEQERIKKEDLRYRT